MTQKIQKFWDKQAKKYDRGEKQFEPVYKAIMAKTGKYLHLNDNALDYGCATGTKTMELAKKVHHIQGLDISAEMINEANKKKDESGLSNISFSQGTIFNTNLEKTSFDKIIAYGIIHLLEDQETLSLPEWEKSWKLIEQKIFQKKQHIFQYSPRNKWILATAAVSLVFILGFFIGRQFLYTKSTLYKTANNIVDFTQTPIESYVESLELLLINFNNRSDQPLEQGLRQLEEELVSNMLMQTRLLKYFISQEEHNADILYLLDDLELLLMSMSNLKPEDKESADQLNVFIRESQLRLRLRQLILAQSI